VAGRKVRRFVRFARLGGEEYRKHNRFIALVRIKARGRGVASGDVGVSEGLGVTGRLMPLKASGALLAGLLASVGAAQAQRQFDGRWSVEVITEQGDCDRAYLYEVIVEGGSVRYAGPEQFDISGRVTQAGRVEGRIQRGNRRADVRGALSGRSGAGTWRATGEMVCSGRWSARKRS
jgi:hypothetical protein